MVGCLPHLVQGVSVAGVGGSLLGKSICLIIAFDARVRPHLSDGGGSPSPGSCVEEVYHGFQEGVVLTFCEGGPVGVEHSVQHADTACTVCVDGDRFVSGEVL